MSSQSSIPPYAIGSYVWPGAAKLAEEAGELVQVIGKLMAYPDSPHPDGSNLQERIVEEVGDVLAAAIYFATANDLVAGTDPRRAAKLARFRQWHDHERLHDES